MKWLRKHLLDVLLITSMAVVASQRALQPFPELFAGGAAIGEVLAALATGYIGA